MAYHQDQRAQEHIDLMTSMQLKYVIRIQQAMLANPLDEALLEHFVNAERTLQELFGVAAAARVDECRFTPANAAMDRAAAMQMQESKPPTNPTASPTVMPPPPDTLN